VDKGYNYNWWEANMATEASHHIETLPDPPESVEEFYEFVFGWPVLRKSEGAPEVPRSDLTGWEIKRAPFMDYAPLILKAGHFLDKKIAPGAPNFADLGSLVVPSIDDIREKLLKYGGRLGQIAVIVMDDEAGVLTKIAYYEDPALHIVALEETCVPPELIESLQ
jgi:hypothetical protein